MKRCTRCKELKPVDAFHARSASKDGLHPRCKACRSFQARKRYDEDKEFRLRALVRSMKAVGSGAHAEANKRWYKKRYVKD